MKTVCVDLDGVLADYEGWKGMDEIGPPIPGAVEFTRRLSYKYRVLIYTCRCSPQAHDGWKEAIPITKKWLDDHGFFYDGIYAGHGKPLAAHYIDDNAHRCLPLTIPTAYEDVLKACEC